MLCVVGDRAHRDWGREHQTRSAMLHGRQPPLHHHHVNFSSDPSSSSSSAVPEIPLTAPPSQVIGAFLSHAPNLEHGHRYFGTKETFVFSFRPPIENTHKVRSHAGLETYRWRPPTTAADEATSPNAPSNQEFIHASAKCLMVGAGGDGPALLVSSDLQHGTSGRHCVTFDTKDTLFGACVVGLAHSEFAVFRLQVFALECAGFVPQPCRISATMLAQHEDDFDHEDEDEQHYKEVSASQERHSAAVFVESDWTTVGCPVASAGHQHHVCTFVERAAAIQRDRTEREQIARSTSIQA